MSSSRYDNTNADQLPKMAAHPEDQNDQTSVALLEQLIYVDSFMPDSDPTTFDNQLTAELAAFADDSFIFPDEDKPKDRGDDGHDLYGRDNFNVGPNNDSQPKNDTAPAWNTQGNNDIPREVTRDNTADNNAQPRNQISPDLLSQSLVTILSTQKSTNNSVIDSLSQSLLSSVPKVQVPPGAMKTLVNAGLSQIQIDALAALIAQHQSRPNGEPQDGPLGFHDSAMDALNVLTNNQAVTNNFTPVQAHAPNNSQLSNLVSILHANSPRDVAADPVRPQVQSSTFEPHFSSHVFNSASPQSTIVPSPSSANTSPSVVMKQEPLDDGQGFSPSGNSSDAADVDKRRRNTAASARFRIKKKLKEQEMQRNIRELNENAHKLQMRIQHLEMENRLLRNLVIEKGAQRNNDEVERLKQRAREGV